MTTPWKQANLSGTWKLQEYLREYKTALRRAKNDGNPVWMKDYTTALKYYTEEFFKLPEEDRVRFPSPTSLKSKTPANDADRRSRLHTALDAVIDAKACDAGRAPSSYMHEAVNLYHLARTALSGKDDSRWARLNWAAKEMHKKYPAVSATAFYMSLSDDWLR